MEAARILIVEDEADIAELLVLHLSDHYAEVQVCSSGPQGLEQGKTGAWDLIILDIRLPGLDGLEVCRSLRAQGVHTPILMLTAKTAELDRVLGLEVGADDYVTKPFSVLEVLARVRALLRRVSIEREENTVHAQQLAVTYGLLRIDEDKRRVDVVVTDASRRASIPNPKLEDINRSKHKSNQVELTPREFDLLLFFARNPGKVYRRTQLLDQVWGYGHEGYEHTVNSHINRLRNKLHQAEPTHEYVVTVWGVGYKFNEDLVSGHAA